MQKQMHVYTMIDRCNLEIIIKKKQKSRNFIYFIFKFKEVKEVLRIIMFLYCPI